VIDNPELPALAPAGADRMCALAETILLDFSHPSMVALLQGRGGLQLTEHERSQHANEPAEKLASTDSTSADFEQGVNPKARPDRHALSYESSDPDGSKRASETETPRE